MAGHVVKQTIDIHAPAKAIFDLLTDPAQHVKIDGSTAGGGGSAMVRRLRRGPARLSMGSTFTMSMRLFGVPYRVTNQVVEFEPNRLIAWRHFEPQHWRYELEHLAGGTRVTESFDYSYWLVFGRSLIRLLGWPGRNQRAIAQTLLRLRADAEQRTVGITLVETARDQPGGNRSARAARNPRRFGRGGMALVRRHEVQVVY